ncbi:MAG: hypothetical protein ACTHK8_08450 [Ginsengibacter sp.]
MIVSKEIIGFRQQRATELLLIEKVIKRVLGNGIKTDPILRAVNQLKDEQFVPSLKDGTQKPEFWGYEIEDFTIPVATDKHVRPIGITNLEMILNMKVIANSAEWTTLSDPLLEMHFNVIIRGIGTETHYLCFHIDRHDPGDNTTEPHPIYHLQYVVNPYKVNNFNYGSVLQIDTPRIMHYPMDFILGVGFLTSNFFPIAFECLLDDGTFANLYKEYQERLWKPFVHSLADHWPFIKQNIVWKPTTLLCPYMI